MHFLMPLPVVPPQDFLEMVPLKEYTHQAGPLNLAGALPPSAIKPDLGPKSYIAYGRCAGSPAGAVQLAPLLQHRSSVPAEVACKQSWGCTLHRLLRSTSLASSLQMQSCRLPSALTATATPLLWRRELELEDEGDSVTKLHCDLSDAVNVLCHMQPTRGAPPAVVRCGRGTRWALPGCARPTAVVMLSSFRLFCTVRSSRHVACPCLGCCS